MYRAILFAAALLTGAVHAQDLSPDFINLGGVSHHYHTQGWALNNANPGLGIGWLKRELPLFGEADVSIGGYLNSHEKLTTYVAVHKLPFELLGGRAGITLALATGYEIAPVVPIPAPTICWKAACVLVTPPFKDKAAGAVSLQFRIPL